MHVDDKDLPAVLSGQPPHESLAAAVYARIETPASPARLLGVLGNYLVVRPAARAAASRATERTDLPLDAAVVLGVGVGALHVWSADPMRSHVGDHLGSIALERIAEIAAETGKSWWPLAMDFVDGESLRLSARGDVPGLVAAFHAAR